MNRQVVHRVGLGRRGRVCLEHAVHLPLPAGDAWRELADLERFACLEFFHRSLWIEGRRPRAGAAIRLRHGIPGIGFDRQGRILRWQPGRGWAFSDLSRRDVQCGFPHVFEVQVTPAGDHACDLVLRVTGRWTLRILPRPLVLLWLATIFRRITNGFDEALLEAALRGAETSTEDRRQPVRRATGGADAGD